MAGDFDDAASVCRAAAGTAAVFAMGTPFEVDADTEQRQAVALVDAVHQAGTRHIVYTSVASALDDTGIPHFESKAAVESHLGTLDVPWTVLAPVAFLENVNSPWVAPGLAQGGYAVDIPPLRAAYPEVGWHGLEDWAAAQDWFAGSDGAAGMAADLSAPSTTR